MDEPLDELYLKWLYSQNGSVRLKNRARTYWSLLRLLYVKEFVWIIPNDDNRVEDGRDLRDEFIHYHGLEGVDREWMALGCSMLEMLVALSRRLSFDAGGEPRYWFWKLMENLDLTKYTDNKVVPPDEVNEVLDRVIWRTYLPDGTGGLFPLDWPATDQREVELWYQFSSYILERE